MSHQHTNQTPEQKVFKINKRRLDQIRKQLDHIRSEQAHIYDNFQKNYSKRQLEDIVSDKEMESLRYEVRDIGIISSVLRRAEIDTIG